MDFMENILPCGCAVLTKQAHIYDIHRCPPCQTKWDRMSEIDVERQDQEIEDAIFEEKA